MESYQFTLLRRASAQVRTWEPGAELPQAQSSKRNLPSQTELYSCPSFAEDIRPAWRSAFHQRLQACPPFRRPTPRRVREIDPRAWLTNYTKSPDALRPRVQGAGPPPLWTRYA